MGDSTAGLRRKVWVTRRKQRQQRKECRFCHTNANWQKSLSDTISLIISMLLSIKVDIQKKIAIKLTLWYARGFLSPKLKIQRGLYATTISFHLNSQISRFDRTSLLVFFSLSQLTVYQYCGPFIASVSTSFSSCMKCYILIWWDFLNMNCWVCNPINRWIHRYTNDK